MPSRIVARKDESYLRRGGEVVWISLQNGTELFDRKMIVFSTVDNASKKQIFDVFFPTVISVDIKYVF